ncbi:MAG: hypothetical protein WD738_23930 [Pirellulales bacterium]
MTDRFNPDAARIRAAAADIANALSKSVAELLPEYARRYGLNGVDTCGAIAAAYISNLVGAVIVGSQLPDTAVGSLQGAIEDVIGDWLEAQKL